MKAGPFPEIDFSRDAFFLDVDGTLLDIAPTPDSVVVPDTLLPVLNEIWLRTGGAMAIVSGRAISGIDGLFAPCKFPAAGCHGSELRRMRDGAVETLSFGIPDELRVSFSALAKLPGTFIEDKGHSLTLHYRLAENPEPLLEDIEKFEKEIAGGDWAFIHAKSAVELKPAMFDKGTAIRSLLRHPPFSGRRAIFAGDDAVDEAAFLAVADVGGFGISVGQPFAGATLLVENPIDIRDWLAELCRN